MSDISSRLPTVRTQALVGPSAHHKLRAIISDIHANVEAYLAVLADIREQKADEIICLGDIVGYGPEPIQCIEITQEVVTWSLGGNHDQVVFMSHAVGFNPSAAKAVAWHRKMIRPSFSSSGRAIERWRWLENLPCRREEGDVLYVHASPHEPLVEYVLEEDFQDMGFGPSEKVIKMYECFGRLCFVGHSHRPGIGTYDRRWVKPAELADMTYILPQDPGLQTIVNIGAVGQPRDRDTRACYVLYDGATVRYRRVPYDIASVQGKIRAIPDLEVRLADRLALGT